MPRSVTRSSKPRRPFPVRLATLFSPTGTGPDGEETAVSWEHDIDALAQQGNDRMDEEDYLGAVELFDRAWDLLPEPKTQWPQATWLLASIGDAHVLRGDFETAHAALTTCMHCPEALGNPFIHLRLGQAQFERMNSCVRTWGRDRRFLPTKIRSTSNSWRARRRISSGRSAEAPKTPTG